MSNPVTDIPPAWRQWAYRIYWLTGLGLGGTTVWYTAIPDTGSVPEWVVRAVAVMGFLSIPLGFTADSNVGNTDTQGRHEK